MSTKNLFPNKVVLRWPRVLQISNSTEGDRIQSRKTQSIQQIKFAVVFGQANIKDLCWQGQPQWKTVVKCPFGVGKEKGVC